MIDKQGILERTNLLALGMHDTHLRKMASTGGGEWAGPCPFCGGSDRFRVQPYKRPWGRWMCRQCTGGKWQNAIDYTMLRGSVDFKTACTVLAGSDPPRTSTRRPAPEIPAYDAPAGDWQACALAVIAVCKLNLWAPMGNQALAYLRGRGLHVRTIDYFDIGFCPGTKFGSLFVPRGIVIPCRAGGVVWYLKISLLPGDPVKCAKCGKQVQARKPCPSCGDVNKYRGVKGNRTGAIFNADDLAGAELALFCEGEIDAMTAWQELRDMIAVVTLGSASNFPDLATWGSNLLTLRQILAVYDSDRAGKKGAESLMKLTDKARYCALPEGVKDINDFYLAGGDLWEFIKPAIDLPNLSDENSLVDHLIDLGGVLKNEFHDVEGDM